MRVGCGRRWKLCDAVVVVAAAWHLRAHQVAEESFDVLRKINDSFCDDSGVPYQDIRWVGEGVCKLCC